MMTEDTQPQIAKFISSQQMVSSEIQARAISLGKALVQELSLEPGVDTLSRWMAHYITEQIAIAEATTGSEKIEAEQQCFNTILKLWERRSSLPNNRYPFKNFESIFQALSSLDPDNPRPYYFDNSHLQKAEKDNTSENQADEIQLWINLALSIDSAARVLIDFAFRQAASNAEDEKTTTWLKKSTGISDDEYDDLSIIVRLVGESQEDNAEEEVREKNRRELNSRIEKLDSL
ncbi:hypothetical protein HC928_23905 [bacterium]|nr:hypothetical protein [bacterium]